MLTTLQCEPDFAELHFRSRQIGFVDDFARRKGDQEASVSQFSKTLRYALWMILLARVELESLYERWKGLLCRQKRNEKYDHSLKAIFRRFGLTDTKRSRNKLWRN
jgi:hypothetical protein